MGSIMQLPEDRVVRSASDDPSVDNLADHTLRCALHATGHGGGVDRSVRDALRKTCDLAHERGLRAEELIVLLKGAWRRLPEVRSMSRDGSDAALARVITMCIGEYYRQPRER